MSRAATDGAPDLLGAIVGAAARSVAVRRSLRSLSEVARQAARMPSRNTAFLDAVTQPGRLNIIAECKRRSPSAGVLHAVYDPVALARAYERAGAAAVSVLTEPAFFDGALEHLAAVARAVNLPALRKDFVVDEYQVAEARAAGAGGILLIVAALNDDQLGRLQAMAESYEVTALVEVHDRADLDRALAAGAKLIGVNNRNLRTMTVNLDTAQDLIGVMPPTTAAVAESGLRTAAEIHALRQAGFRAFLIGEHLMRSGDAGVALAELIAATTALGDGA